jgi:hypothetical protein
MLKPMVEADIHTGSEVCLPVASGTVLAVENTPVVFEAVAAENSPAVFGAVAVAAENSPAVFEAVAAAVENSHAVFGDVAAAVEDSPAVFGAVAVAEVVPMERHSYHTVAKAVDRYWCFDLRQ